MPIPFIEVIPVLMFFLCFFGLITSRSVLKSLIAVSIMDSAVVMFYLSPGYNAEVSPPIGFPAGHVADPLPQSLVVTTIILGAAVTAITLVMVISLYRRYKTTDWETLRKESLE